MRRATSILILALAASSACGSGDTPTPTAGPSVTSPTQGNPAPPAPQQDGGPIAFSMTPLPDDDDTIVGIASQQTGG